MLSNFNSVFDELKIHALVVLSSINSVPGALGVAGRFLILPVLL